MQADRASDAAFAAAFCALLAAYNNVAGLHPWHRRWYVAVNACATGAALSAGAASGLTAVDMGLPRGGWRPGRPATRLAAGIAAGWLLAAVVPAARPVLNDQRIASLDGRAVAYGAAVRIPLGTVLWEEAAFRGVLQAALRRVMPETAAIAVASGMFGIWHIRPTVEALRANGLAPGRRQAAAGLLAGVATTTAGGALLSWLRARSGTLAAPVLLHLATNSGGQVAAWAAATMNRGPHAQTGRRRLALALAHRRIEIYRLASEHGGFSGMRRITWRLDPTCASDTPTGRLPPPTCATITHRAG